MTRHKCDICDNKSEYFEYGWVDVDIEFWKGRYEYRECDNYTLVACSPECFIQIVRDFVNKADDLNQMKNDVDISEIYGFDLRFARKLVEYLDKVEK